jgi:hypothetical protein
MLHWRVIALAVLAVLLILGGLVALTLPNSYEGAVLYTLDEQHAVSKLDGIGAILSGLGCGVALVAGFVWQRRVALP